MKELRARYKVYVHEIELGFGVLVFEEGGKQENSEKNPRSKARTNNKLNPHMTPGPGIEPGPHWWEASTLTTAPSLLPTKT